MGKTAIILGATGLTGKLLLHRLLKDERYSKIMLFSRSTCGISNPKLEEHLIDVFSLKDYQDIFKGDVVFCCVGTTKVKTPDKETYVKIDYGIPVDSAELCKANNINTFIVVSALGANKNSNIFYNRTKGRMEEAVLGLQIPNTYILQPSLITGDRQESRFGESLAKFVMKIFNPLLVGSLKTYKSIGAKTIANCMVWLNNHDYESGRITSDKIKILVNK
ncbi:NAD(P)H-binding protein [Mangrovimonas aestuarii]|uniref:NAD(P)H-binding protein n=1 Tax=Mangrovimonas aestuarii TaxID=3018443 RepID=UPI0023780D93|nr:NAD(P)H-binding protein [Mangrovimonas aestuarii]